MPRLAGGSAHHPCKAPVTTFFESVHVMPEGVGSAQLHIHETVRSIPSFSIRDPQLLLPSHAQLFLKESIDRLCRQCVRMLIRVGVVRVHGDACRGQIAENR